MQVVMRQALLDAALEPEQIAYVSAHGTAAELGDIAESHATQAVFGSKIPISSLKSYTGHTLGACGALEGHGRNPHDEEGWFHRLNLGIS
jgi:3-oxoacyl-[acyl-carrier-protein] synthase II